jgi:hypothetical protein
MPWTTDDLVDSVRRRAQLPDVVADGAISDTDILDIANDEIALRLVPLVRRAREDYFVEYEDQTIVVGTASYRIPENAQGSALRDVTVVDSDGNEYSVPRISLEEAGAADRYAQRTAFVMEGPFVRLVPVPTSAYGTLRLRYHRSHAQLVPVSGTALCTLVSDGSAIYPDTSVIQSTTKGEAGTNSPFVGLAVDIVRAYSPFAHDYNNLVIASITNDSGNDTATFTGPYPSTDAITSFDNTERQAYMCFFGTSCVIRLPRECWPLLVSAVAARVLEIVGDRDAAQVAYSLYDREKDNVVELLTPRVEGARKKIIAHWSPLRTRRRW